jgi:hypothetical protein
MDVSNVLHRRLWIHTYRLRRCHFSFHILSIFSIRTNQPCSIVFHKRLEIISPRHPKQDLLIRPVPPFDLQQHANLSLLEAIANDFGGVADDDGIGRYIFSYDGIGSDDSSIADSDGVDDRSSIANPDVIADLDMSRAEKFMDITDGV